MRGRGRDAAPPNASTNQAVLQDAEDLRTARELNDLRKKAEVLQGKADKMKAENVGLREVQKSLEKERKADQKRLDGLQRRIGSAEDVEKATALIPTTLKKIEDAVSGQRISLLKASTQQAAEMMKSNHSVAQSVTALSESVASMSALLSKVVTRMDKLEGSVQENIRNVNAQKKRSSGEGDHEESVKKRSQECDKASPEGCGSTVVNKF